MSKWQTIYQTSLDHQAHIVKDVLATSGIESIILNLRDYAHNIGRLEVKVQPESVLEAIRIIQEIDLK